MSNNNNVKSADFTAPGIDNEAAKKTVEILDQRIAH